MAGENGMKRLIVLSLFLGGVTSAYASDGLWHPTAITGTSHWTTDNNYTYGNKIQFKTNGSITQLVFWKDSNDTTTTRTMILWDASGDNLASCTTSSEPTGTSQWVGCTLATPYAVTANPSFSATYQIYFVTANYPTGSVQPYVLSSCAQAGGSIGATDPNNSNLVCDADQQYHYGAVSTFPNQTTTTATDFVDVVFVPCS